MNPHPLLVHFPIALLTIYCILEFIRFKKIQEQPYWFYFKALLACVGGLALLAARQAGDAAAAPFRSDLALRPVLRMHENWANITIFIFGIIGAVYLFEWMHRQFPNLFRRSSFAKIWKIVITVEQKILQSPLIILLAIAGLIAITITGGLGGSLVYGQNVDPAVQLIYKIFFPGR